MRSLVSTLDTKLRETLREDLSGTYGVSVSSSYSKFPVQRYRLDISLGCNPQRVDELVKAIFREIDNLQANGPTEKQVNEVRQGFLRDYETNIKLNSYLLAQIAVRYQEGEDPEGLLQLPRGLQEDGRRRPHPGGGEDVPEQGQLRPGDAAARDAGASGGTDDCQSALRMNGRFSR